MNKRLKYRLLRRMPGALGRRYARKYGILLDRTEGFAEALRRSRGMTCIDLGANLGKHTRQMATTVRQVIAFEPDPWAFSALRSNVADLENVRLENLAAGTSNGIVPLYRHLRFDSNPDAYSQSSTVVSGKFNVSTEGAVAVRQVDFLQYLEEFGEEVGVLKIDIEGAEVDLLEALFAKPEMLARIHYIFAETHETKIPGHAPRVAALREQARRIQHPIINLHWY